MPNPVTPPPAPTISTTISTTSPPHPNPPATSPGAPAAPIASATAAVGWLRSVLRAFLTSKKSLAAGLAAGLVVVIRGIAGAAGIDVDQDALDRVFLAFLAFVGAQGLSDFGKGAQSAATSLQAVLSDLVRDKKFLAATAAALATAAAPLAGRIGITLDAASLDRVFQAALLYIGAQGLAEFGQGRSQGQAAGQVPGSTTAAHPDPGATQGAVSGGTVTAAAPPPGTGDAPRGSSAPT